MTKGISLFLALALGLAPAALPLFPQGMGGAKAVARGSRLAETEQLTPRLEFRDVAASLGIRHKNVYGGDSAKRYILEMTGNGLAIFDFDNDGLRDLFFVQGTRLEEAGGSHVLYRNTGDGFEDVSADSGLSSPGWGQGVCAGDYDNDGRTDLLVAYYGHNRLFRNIGSGRFENVTAKAGLPVEGARWGSSCSFLDYNLDGRLDLFVSNYLQFNLEEAAVPGASAYCRWRGLPVFCGPRGYDSGTHLLYRNEGEGGFRDVSREAGIALDEPHFGLGATAADFDDDGLPDIYVACDSTPNILYRNNGDGTFTDVAVEAGVAYGDAGQEEGSMGAATGDFDNDGLLDIAVTNFIDETSTLYRNGGDSFFDDVTYLAGLGVNTRQVGWGVEFLDVDQDGWKDLVAANGHIYPELRSASVGESYEQRNTLYWNLRNGAFRDVTESAGPAFAATRTSRGLATGDLDGDGSPELVIVEMNAAPTVLKNASARGNALLVELVGTKSNKSAIGARVTLTAGDLVQTDEVRSGSSYGSQSGFRLHFGLGEAVSVDELRVRWPGGGEEVVELVEANQTMTIREGEGIVEKRPFRTPE